MRINDKILILIKDVDDCIIAQYDHFDSMKEAKKEFSDYKKTPLNTVKGFFKGTIPHTIQLIKNEEVILDHFWN